MEIDLRPIIADIASQADDFLGGIAGKPSEFLVDGENVAVGTGDHDRISGAVTRRDRVRRCRFCRGRGRDFPKQPVNEVKGAFNAHRMGADFDQASALYAGFRRYLDLETHTG